MAKSECCGTQKSQQAEANPMAMGMGQGGSPMEMMHQMMAQMGAGEGKPPMQDMMCMCGEVLGAIKQTNALAVHATPELEQAFGEWLTRLEGEALGLLATGTTDAASLAKALKISEASAVYLLNRLAVAGKVTLSGKLRTKDGGSYGGS